MGLNIVCADDHTPFSGASWSYSGFMAFRERLAKAAGLIAQDDTLDHFFDRIDVTAFEAGDKNALRAFPSQFNEPLVLLIDHSDCYGDLSPDQCRRLAPRLEKLMEEWPAGDYDLAQGMRLVAACNRCAREKVLLEFR